MNSVNYPFVCDCVQSLSVISGQVSGCSMQCECQCFTVCHLPVICLFVCNPPAVFQDVSVLRLPPLFQDKSVDVSLWCDNQCFTVFHLSLSCAIFLCNILPLCEDKSVICVLAVFQDKSVDVLCSVKTGQSDLHVDVRKFLAADPRGSYETWRHNIQPKSEQIMLLNISYLIFIG